MTVSRESIQGVSTEIKSQQYDKQLGTLVGQGSVDYASFTAPVLDTSITVLNWPMIVSERSRHMDADSWRSSITVRDPLLDSLEAVTIKRHVFISSGYNRGIGSIVPENQRDLVEIHEKGGDDDEDAAWTAVSITEFMADLLGFEVVISCLDYTVSLVEFGENTSITDVIQQFFSMYDPKIFVSGGKLYVLDRLAGAIGSPVVVNNSALVVDVRESREAMPATIKVIGASTSRSNLLKEKPVRTFTEDVYDYTFHWKGYGYEDLEEKTESEIERTWTTYRYGLDVDGNRQYLVKTITSVERRKDGKEGAPWIVAQEEIVFNKYSRTSNIWEAPRLDYTVQGLAHWMWKQNQPQGRPPTVIPGDPFRIVKNNSTYGWDYEYVEGCAYMFRRYVYGEDPWTNRLIDENGDPVSQGGAVPNINQPSSANRMQGYVGGEAAPFRLFGALAGNPQGVRPGSFAVLGRSLYGGVRQSTQQNNQQSTLGGDFLVAEITTHKAILVAKSKNPMDPDGSKCYVPSYKLDRWTPLNADSEYWPSPSSNVQPSSQGLSDDQKSAMAGGGPAGGKSVPFYDPSQYDPDPDKSDLPEVEEGERPGPGEAPPGGFEDDFFNQFYTAAGRGAPVWGSHILVYKPMTRQRHVQIEHSVFYDEEQDINENNNLVIESSHKEVSSPNPTSPLRKKKVQATWQTPVETEIDGPGDGPALVVQNSAIATQEDADAVAARLSLIYAKSNRQFVTILLSVDLTPDIGWGVSGTISHPNGPSVTIGGNGFIVGFSKSLDATSSERTVQILVEADL